MANRLLIVVRNGMVEHVIHNLAAQPIITVFEYRLNEKAPVIVDKDVTTGFATAENIAEAIKGARAMRELTDNERAGKPQDNGKESIQSGKS